MISSMTGYGRGEATCGDVTILVELRSVNSRFLEVVSRLPRSLSLRENEIRDIIRRKISRGKVSLASTVEKSGNGTLSLRVDASAAKGYYHLLNDLRRAVRLKETVKLEHLLKFSEIFEQDGIESANEDEWEALQKALDAALEDLARMRAGEGKELKNDLARRVQRLSEMVGTVENLSKEQIPAERERLKNVIAQLIQKPMDEGRLETEIALLAERLDVTEECVRFRSHNKFFLQAFDDSEAAGRKLNFLVQEMNREANTIGAKSSSTEIAHLVVGMKEELEKIREQLQNVE
jgi:uncharacterized protein (TIGR00255 family)